MKLIRTFCLIRPSFKIIIISFLYNDAGDNDDDHEDDVEEEEDAEHEHDVDDDDEEEEAFMMAFVTWFQKEAGQIVKGGTSEVTVVGSVLLINIIIIITRPRPAFGRLGLGGSSGGYSSHG